MPSGGGFVPFGPDHLAVLAFTLAGAGALVTARQWLRARDDRWIRWTLAGVLVGNELLALVLMGAEGRLHPPLQLCDLAMALTVWALVSLRRTAAQVAYFWGLSGSTQALLTPDLREAFPAFWWFIFFLAHCGVVLSVVYLGVTGRVQPTQHALWRAWAWAAGYVVVMLWVDEHFGANYGYVLRKPAHPSLLDYFGPWPQYVFVMSGVALALFYVCYLPFAWSRRSARRRQASQA